MVIVLRIRYIVKISRWSLVSGIWFAYCSLLITGYLLLNSLLAMTKWYTVLRIMYIVEIQLLVGSSFRGGQGKGFSYKYYLLSIIGGMNKKDSIYYQIK